MKESVKLLHYVDPGHSWLRVSHKMLKKLGIADKISSFSYQRTEYAYLEEDVDMTTFMQAMESRGQRVTFVTRSTNRQCRIRNYDHYDFIVKSDIDMVDVVDNIESVVTETVTDTVMEKAE